MKTLNTLTKALPLAALLSTSCTLEPQTPEEDIAHFNCDELKARVTAVLNENNSKPEDWVDQEAELHDLSLVERAKGCK